MRQRLPASSSVKNHEGSKKNTFSPQDLELFRHYRVAQQSLECYLKGVNYTVIMVDLDNDPRVKEKCSKNQQVRFAFVLTSSETLASIHVANCNHNSGFVAHHFCRLSLSNLHFFLVVKKNIVKFIQF